MSSRYRKFFISMAVFWMFFGLGTSFYPRMMQWFMTPEGVAASTPFSDQVWLHDGFDILSVSLLLFALSMLPVTKTSLRLAGVVALFPGAGIISSLVATPYWTPLFIVPALGCFAFAVIAFALAQRAPATS